MSDGPTASTEQRTVDRVREYQRVIEALSRIGPQALTAQQLMQHVTAQVSRATMIARTKVLRYRPERGDLLVEAGVGWKPGVVGNATLAVDYRSPAGRAFQPGAPVTIEDIRETEEFRNPDLLREHGIVAIINVPVVIDGATWGVLEADSTQPGCFDQWDVSFLSVVANIMGVCQALERANRKHVEATAEAVRQEAQFDMRLRELQHRIKNNLQIVVAFLSRRTRELPQVGLSLVEGFAQQIQGRVEYVPIETGSKTTFCFPATIEPSSI
jgi:GAF domain-containing protein